MSTARPQQYGVASCFGSTTPPNFAFHDFGFDAMSVTLANNGPDPIYVNLATSTTACSTGTGVRVDSGEIWPFSGMAMPVMQLVTTSSGQTGYRVGAWRW